MNYRHAFHAGNFADVMKHALLVRILLHLQRKETPIRVIDTHAGIGLYDLAADEAERTGEWRDGFGRLEEPFPAPAENLLAPYRAVVSGLRERFGPSTYPGSPAILRELLRSQDRGVLVELHPDDYAALSRRYNAVKTLKVLHLDGWTALHAFIPPKERRGLVLVDPPYEEPGELARLSVEFLKAVEKWPTGVYAGWYPIKDQRSADSGLGPLMRGLDDRPGLRLELLIDRADRPDRLNGCGLVLVNPPWRLRDEAEILLPALAERLARGRYGGFRCEPFGRA